MKKATAVVGVVDIVTRICSTTQSIPWLICPAWLVTSVRPSFSVIVDGDQKRHIAGRRTAGGQRSVALKTGQLFCFKQRAIVLLFILLIAVHQRNVHIAETHQQVTSCGCRRLQLLLL